MKPLLVGEANPYGADPGFALWPEPRYASGDRLCRLVMGLEQGEYLRRFDRVNLCSTTWSLRAARERAAHIVGTERREVVVALGSRVARAFGVEFDPFNFYRVGVPGPLTTVVVLPHPSGLSRIWNNPGSYDLARSVLRQVGVL